MEILLLGHPKSSTTRKAQRYLSERGVVFHDRDLRKRAPSSGELRRWVQKYGVEGVLDTSSKAYREQGLRYLGADPDDWLERLAADPMLLKLPLVRRGNLLAVGEDPQGWQAIVDASRE